MQMHKILTVWTLTGNLKYTWHDTFLWTEDSYHSHENRIFILYFGFIHNEHKVNKRSTNHTSPKEQNMELWHAWTPNIPYKPFIFSVEFWVLSRTQNLKVKMSKRMYWVFQYQNQSTCLLEVSGCFLGFWNRLLPWLNNRKAPPRHCRINARTD